jgi:hypothetical protein
VDRLEHLGGSPVDLKAILEWCADNDADLVALDVGLDTSTDEGRLAAGHLLAVGGHQNGDSEATPKPGGRSRART